MKKWRKFSTPGFQGVTNPTAVLYHIIMTITVDSSAVKRIQKLREKNGDPALMLRIRVDGGGCSGFQYKFELTSDTAKDDDSFGGCILTDSISLPFLDGAVISYDESLIGSEFKIDNPNAIAGCGCGTSFSIAQ